MRQIDSAFLLLALYGLSALAHGQAASEPKPTPNPTITPTYRISFERRNPVEGLDASPAIKLPFECTKDGTVFITMVPLGAQIRPPSFAPPPMLLASVSPSGRVNTFPLDQVTEQLYDVREVDHYASESNVVFLVKAARENKPTKRVYTGPGGIQGELTNNAADRHFFIIVFNRDGEHTKTLEADVPFEIRQIGVFSTGSFLAFGYDQKDHTPKLAMLSDDGTLMRWLQISKDDAPASLLKTKDDNGKGPAVYIAPSQFVAEGRSIVLAQTKTRFPLLEISEGGEIRSIHPKLPKDAQIEGLIPGDQNLLARVSAATDDSIYELDVHDGTVLRRFELSDGQSSSAVACVYDEKFLSFEHGEGKLIPLLGTLEPSSGSTYADKPKSGSSRTAKQ